MSVLSKFGREVLEQAIKNRPLIATIAALGSLGLMGVLTYKEAPKIIKIKEKHKKKIEKIKTDDTLTSEEAKTKIVEARIETAKEALVPVGKIVGAFTLTAALILSINKAHNLRTEALIAAYEVSKGKVMGYENVLPDIVGPKKAEELKTKITSEVANKAAEGQASVIINDDTKCLCRDVFGNQWVGTYNDIEEAKNNLNADLQDCDVSLNDFYGYLPYCNRSKFGDEMLFLRENGKVDIRYSTQMDEWTHKPMIVIDYACSPRCMDKRYIMTSSEAKDRWRYGDLG